MTLDELRRLVIHFTVLAAKAGDRAIRAQAQQNAYQLAADQLEATLSRMERSA